MCVWGGGEYDMRVCSEYMIFAQTCKKKEKDKKRAHGRKMLEFTESCVV